MSNSMSKREAHSICGSLSKPSKMPGYAYSLPAQQCRLGGLLRHIPRAVCAHCYALRGRYLFPVVRGAMERRLESISDPRWVEAISSLIRRSGETHFRWHDSGDIQSLEHLSKIVAVCKILPGVKFWLPTREYQMVEAYRRMGGQIPPNLCIRYSTHLVDGRPPLRYEMPISTVSSSLDKVPVGAHRCPAAKHGNVCGRCRACWDRQVKIINLPLKWPSPTFRIPGREVGK
jgi:protein gp88